MLGAPDLDVGLQVGPHKGRAEGDNHLPPPAAHSSLDAAQDAVGLLGCMCSLLAHVEHFMQQNPQVLLCRAALNEFFSQPIPMSGISPAQVQHLALGLVDPPYVNMGPNFKLVPDQSGGFLQWSDHIRQQGKTD